MSTADDHADAGGRDGDHPTPADGRDRFATRLREAGLSVVRFIDVVEGKKGSHDHTQRPPGDSSLSGNYGIYAGVGDDDGEGGYLIDVDVDDYDDGVDNEALAVVDDLPATFTVTSPHTSEESPGHRYYRVAGDPIEVVRDVRDDDTLSNPTMSWGEIRIENQYTVGPGSQLDDCDKEWCDVCATAGGGYYRISEDRPIATISEEQLAEVLEADRSESSTPTRGDASDSEPTGSDSTDHSTDVSSVLKANPWIGPYLALGTDDDRSKKDFAVCVALIENGVSEDDARDLLNDSSHTKVHERGRSYWDRTWSNAWAKADLPGSGGGAGGEDGDPPTGDEGESDKNTSWAENTVPFANAVTDPNSPTTLKSARTQAAQLARGDYDFLTPRADGEDLNKYNLWVYEPQDGCFERRGDATIASDATGTIEAFSTSDQTEVANLIKRQTLTDRDKLDGEAEDTLLINVENGVYYFEADELRENDPDLNFRHVHPFEYDPDASGDEIVAFLENVTEEEHEVQTLLEYIGYCFDDGYPLGNFLLLYGSGGNGKGILFDVIEELLGSPTTSYVGLDTMLGDNTHHLAELDGAFVNIDGDVEGSYINSRELNMIKKLTGRDAIKVDRKYEHPFTLENRAKLMFAANQPPRFNDSTNSVARRLLAIEFPYEFVNNPTEPHQKQRRPHREVIGELTTDEALSGLFNRAMEAYRGVRDTGQFSIESQGSNAERLADYRRQADPIVAFADSVLENREGFAIPHEAVYAMYTRYADSCGFHPAEMNVFFRQLRRNTSIDIHKTQPRINTSGGVKRPSVCDHLWLTPSGREYLSGAGRSDTLTVMAKTHNENLDTARDALGMVPTTDGGSGENVETTEIPDDADGLVADTQRVCRLVDNNGGVGRGALPGRASDALGLHPERVIACTNRALKQGDLLITETDTIETPRN